MMFCLLCILQGLPVAGPVERKNIAYDSLIFPFSIFFFEYLVCYFI